MGIYELRVVWPKRKMVPGNRQKGKGTWVILELPAKENGSADSHPHSIFHSHEKWNQPKPALKVASQANLEKVTYFQNPQYKHNTLDNEAKLSKVIVNRIQSHLASIKMDFRSVCIFRSYCLISEPETCCLRRKKKFYFFRKCQGATNFNLLQLEGRQWAYLTSRSIPSRVSSC